MIKRIHHVGIAVNSLKESAPLYEKVLGVKPEYHDAPGQKVMEAVFEIGGGAELDLLEPTAPESTLVKFLEKKGEGLHHLALEVDDINQALDTCGAKGFRLIDEEGREGVAGQIGFLHPKSLAGVMIELIQPTEKQKITRPERIKQIHHIALAVQNIDEAVKLYTSMLGRQPVWQYEVPGAGILSAGYMVGETALEITEGAPGSPVGDFFSAHGEGLYHISFEVEDVKVELERLAAAGITPRDTEPLPGPDGPVAFLGPEGAHGVTVELMRPDNRYQDTMFAPSADDNGRS